MYFVAVRKIVKNEPLLVANDQKYRRHEKLQFLRLPAGPENTLVRRYKAPDILEAENLSSSDWPYNRAANISRMSVVTIEMVSQSVTVDLRCCSIDAMQQNLQWY